MKKMNVALAAVFFCLLMAGNGWAVSYNSPIDDGWHVGQGQDNAGFVINEGNGVEVALRAQIREVGVAPNGVAGCGTSEEVAVYFVEPGTDWNYDFHIDSRGSGELLVHGLLEVDFIADDGTESSWSWERDIPAHMLRQDSENLAFCTWGPRDCFGPIYDSAEEGVYQFTLSVFDDLCDPQFMTSVSMNVVVSSVPVPAAGLLLGSGLLGLIGWRRREMA